MKDRKGDSLSDRVFFGMEDDILNGKYQPGESLPEMMLCEAFNVSRTPVREALSRLEQEGLVMIVPNKGTMVTGISEKDMVDIYEIRIRIEGLAACWSAQRITDAQLGAIREMVDLQEFYTIKGDMEMVKTMDSRFHQALYEDCGSAALTSILTDLHRKIQHFRKTSLSSSDRAFKSAEEHRAIYNALAARNSALAEQQTIQHIANARDNLVALYRAGTKGRNQ